MKIWVNPFGLKHAQELIKNKNVNYIIVGIDSFSVRNSCLLKLNEIKKINCNKLAVSLNNLYTDDQINELTKILTFLKQIKVKTIIFSDFAIKQICDEIKYKPYFVYYSGPLATNYDQIPFYTENGINELILPHELFLNEIIEFGKNKKKIKLQVQTEGYGLLMHSKWNLLLNFKKQFNIKKDLRNKKLFIKEETRNLPNIIWEDNTGTHLFTGYNVSFLNYLQELSNSKIDSLWFNGFLNDKSWIDMNIDIYAHALRDIKIKKFAKQKSKYLSQIKQINEISSCGFLDPTKGLLHLDREVNND